MTSRRTGWDLAAAAFAARLEAVRVTGGPRLALTETNSTRVGLAESAAELAEALADPRVARHDPSPQGAVSRTSSRAALARLEVIADAYLSWRRRTRRRSPSRSSTRLRGPPGVSPRLRAPGSPRRLAPPPPDPLEEGSGPWRRGSPESW